MFRRQLIIGHVALLFVTILTGTAALIALQATSVRLSRVASDLAADMITFERLRFRAEQVVATSRGYLLTGDPKTLERFERSVAHVNQTLPTLERRRGEFGEDVARIETATKTYVAAARGAAAQRAKTDDPRELVPLFEQLLMPARNQFEDAIASFVRREEATFHNASQQARDFADRTRLIIGTTTTLGIALGIALAWLSSRKLTAQYVREQEATSAAQRAAAVRDELLAVVSHDLRSPLTAISLGAAVLDAKVVDPSTCKQVAMIRRAADHMDHLIGELLDVAKLESGTLELRHEPCAVDLLLDGVAALFTARAAQLDLGLTIESGHAGNVIGDRERLLQVLSNLVSNSVKFTPPGGRIMLVAHREGDVVRIAVTDTGPGIPSTDVPHLFERYWQGRRRGRGSLGLGLYICRQIVEAHHGRIGVETRAGEGSTFWVSIPAAPA